MRKINNHSAKSCSPSSKTFKISHKLGYWKLSCFLALVFLTTLGTSSLSARRIGLLIATNYKGNTVGTPPLKECERDASLIKSHLLKHAKFDSVKVLLGKMVTAKELGLSLRNLAQTVRSTDTVLIYFSGHGTYQKDASASNGLRNFLVMYKRPHIPDNLLSKWIKKIKTKKLVWIFDACHSGGIASKNKLNKGSGNIQVAKGQMAKVIENGDENLFFGNRAIIGSSAANQTAIEIGYPIRHGIFSYYFAKSLNPKDGDLNRDGTVTLLESFEWTKPRVIKKAGQFNHRQTPIIGGNVSGILLSGKRRATPPPKVKPPKLSQAKPPKPSSAKPVPSVLEPSDPIKASEPAVVPHSKNSTVVLYTTIYKSSVAGPSYTNPRKIIAKNKKADTKRKISVSISEHNYPLKIEWLDAKALKAQSSEQIPLGVYSHRSKVYKNRVAKITIKNVPTGVHEIVLKADGYPVIKKRLGVEKDNKNNKLFIVASLAGYGTIKGKVFLKSFDRPVARHRIYMPKIAQTNQIHSMLTASDGSFWFLNLKPAKDYFLKASFAEALPLDNKKLSVKANTTTKVDVVLNRKY